jgi:hypothetical protein
MGMRGHLRQVTPNALNALNAISKDDLRKRFDLKAMMAARIYPVRDQSELRLAEENFALVSRYYAEAAAAGNAMRLWAV